MTTINTIGVATGAANTLLQGQGVGTAPAFSTATYPATTTVSEILYSSSANVVAGITTGNNGTLITSAGGVPSISSTLPSAVQGNITTVGALSSGSLAAGFTPVTVPIGGTGNTTFTAYSIICAGTTATGAFQNVSGVGTAAQVLTSNGAGLLPTWQSAGGGVTSLTGTANQVTVSAATGAVTLSLPTLVSITSAQINSLSIGRFGHPNEIQGGDPIYLATNGPGGVGGSGAVEIYSANSAGPPPLRLHQNNSASAYVGLMASNSLGSSYNLTLPLVQGDSFSSIVNDGSGVLSWATSPGKNRLVNGDFQCWQRGAGGSAAITAAASTTKYTADRWQIATGANQACTVTQTAGATSGSYTAKFARDNGETGTGVLRFCSSLTRQMCVGAAGNIITLSFKAKKGANYSSASSALTYTVYSGTGTTDISGIAGAFTGSATPISATATLTSTLTNFAGSSSALGSTITQLAVEFSFTPSGTAGAADNFEVTDVCLEVSPSQSSYDRKSFQQTLNECYFFYNKSFAYGTAPAQNVGAVSTEAMFGATTTAAVSMVGSTIYYPVRMRASPTITIYNPAAANAQFRDQTGGFDCSSSSGYNGGAAGFTPNCLGNALTVPGDIIAFHWQADAELA